MKLLDLEDDDRSKLPGQLFASKMVIVPFKVKDIPVEFKLGVFLPNVSLRPIKLLLIKLITLIVTTSCGVMCRPLP